MSRPTLIKPHELPKSCPACGRSFSSVLQPRRRMQKKAVLLVFFGTGLSLLWAAVVCAGVASIRGVVIPLNPFTGTVIICVVVAPGLLVGLFAGRFPKLARSECRKCGWSQDFLMDEGAANLAKRRAEEKAKRK